MKQIALGLLQPHISCDELQRSQTAQARPTAAGAALFRASWLSTDLGGLKTRLAPIGAALVLIFEFGAKLKVLVIPLAKFFPILLKTGGTMVLSMWAYALAWGWMYAVGFVLLILVHERGHLLIARLFGLKVGAPVFIPFMGAFIAWKDAPKNAWIEAWVGVGGPLLGAAGPMVCEVLVVLTGDPLFRALGFSGFFLYLFNLVPIGVLDGGRIVTALSPWLWLVGATVMGCCCCSIRTSSSASFSPSRCPGCGSCSARKATNNAATSR